MEGSEGLGWDASVSVENAFVLVEMCVACSGSMVFGSQRLWKRNLMFGGNEGVAPFPVLEECSRSRVAFEQRSFSRKNILTMPCQPLRIPSHLVHDCMKRMMSDKS